MFYEFAFVAVFICVLEQECFVQQAKTILLFSHAACLGNEFFLSGSSYRSMTMACGVPWMGSHRKT